MNYLFYSDNLDVTREHLDDTFVDLVHFAQLCRSSTMDFYHHANCSRST